MVATQGQISVQAAAQAQLEGDEVRIERSAVGVIRAATVDLSQGVVGLVLAQGDVWSAREALEASSRVAISASPGEVAGCSQPAETHRSERAGSAACSPWVT
jgi:hypothetical protein